MKLPERTEAVVEWSQPEPTVLQRADLGNGPNAFKGAKKIDPEKSSSLLMSDLKLIHNI